jgi:hypothetical protein
MLIETPGKDRRVCAFQQVIFIATIKLKPVGLTHPTVPHVPDIFLVTAIS